jgi:hypothetical protein
MYVGVGSDGRTLYINTTNVHTALVCVKPSRPLSSQLSLKLAFDLKACNQACNRVSRIRKAANPRRCIHEGCLPNTIRLPDFSLLGTLNDDS